MSFLLALVLSSFAPEARPVCDSATAQRVTIEAVLVDAGRLAGQCVTLSGAPFGRYLTPVPTREWSLSRLAVYEHQPALLARRDWLGVRRWAVTGIVDTCENLGRQAREEARRGAAEASGAGRPPAPAVPPMLAGPCHYFNEVILWVADFHPVESPD